MIQDPTTEGTPARPSRFQRTRALWLAPALCWLLVGSLAAQDGAVAEPPVGAEPAVEAPEKGTDAGAGTPVERAEAATEVPPLIPKLISKAGGEVDRLFLLIFWITSIAGVIVLGLMAIFLVKYRHRPGKKTASGTHGSNKLEVTWTVGTVLILVFIAFEQRASWISLKQTFGQEDGVSNSEMLQRKDTLLVRVYAEQFAWYFNYPGADGEWEEQRASYADPINKVGLDDPGRDFMSSELVVPEGVTVVCELHSLGKYDANASDEKSRYTWPVLHSFFSPNLRLKQDVVPFHPVKIWFRVEAGQGHTGTYEISCAELCGEGHYLMNAPFRVVTREEFDTFLGYDYTAAHPGGFPAAVHYHEEPKDE